jgi:hypothetical protein
MYYLADFEYQKPDKRYWSTLYEDSKRRSRIRKKLIRNNLGISQEKSDLKAYRKSPNYEELTKAFSELKSVKTEKERTVLGNQIRTLLSTPYNQKRFSTKLTPLLSDQRMSESMKNFYNDLGEAIYKGKEKDRIDNLINKGIKKRVEEINQETVRANNIKKLRKTALKGTLGVAGLGVVAYGVNKLRKSRSDKGRKRGKYNGRY